MTEFTALPMTDPNGVIRYYRVEGNSTVQGNPAVVTNDPFNRDCLSAQVGSAANADIVAAVASKTIRVLAISISADAACNITLQSGGTSNIFGPIYLDANTSFSVDCNTGLFETVAGEKLNAVLAGVANYSVSVRYREI